MSSRPLTPRPVAAPEEPEAFERATPSPGSASSQPNSPEPSVCVDWESGTAAFSPGQKLQGTSDQLLRLDVLDSLRSSVNFAYEQAFEAAYPGHLEFVTRIRNLSRMRAAEFLEGATIAKAISLSDGGLALELADGKVLAFSPSTVGIGVRHCAELSHAELEADYSPQSNPRYMEIISSKDITGMWQHFALEQELQELNIALPVPH